MRATLYLGVVLVTASGVVAQKGPARPPIIDVHLHTYSAVIAAHHPSNPATGQPGPVFGTDQMNWPDAIGMAIASIQSADFLSEQQKRDILYNNAARFLRLGRTEGR